MLFVKTTTIKITNVQYGEMMKQQIQALYLTRTTAVHLFSLSPLALQAPILIQPRVLVLNKTATISKARRGLHSQNGVSPMFSSHQTNRERAPPALF